MLDVTNVLCKRLDVSLDSAIVAGLPTISSNEVAESLPFDGAAAARTAMFLYGILDRIDAGFGWAPWRPSKVFAKPSREFCGAKSAWGGIDLLFA